MHVLLREYHEALEAVKAAEARATEALRRACPVGSTVFWPHGESQRQGRVLDVSDDRVRIDNGISAPYWISAVRIRDRSLEPDQC